MDKNLILEILNDWNFWNKDQETGKERKGYLKRCLSLLKSNVVIAIIGIRRAGKSYLMRQIAKHLISTGVEPRNILIINFEDQRFTELYPGILQEIYERYLEFLYPTGKPFIFLDEVYNVPGWERWVRTVHELGKAKIIISGSSSKLLGSELSTVLTGRHLDVYIYPLDFNEFLSFRDITIDDRMDIISKKIEIKALIREYIEWGGFPEVVLGANKRILLLTYFDDILTKDIERRYKIRKGELLRMLGKFYLTNIATHMTFNSIGKFLNASTLTVEKFSSYLEEANLVFFIRKFSYSVKEQEKSPRKLYAMDIGMANSIGFKFSENLGRLIENVVSLKLKKEQSFNPDLEVYYWQHNNKEVDFIIKEGLKVTKLIQCCWNIDEFGIRKRELKPLMAAMEKFKLNEGIVITGDYEKDEEVNSKVIRYTPLWKWLLM
ncbi:MAG: ATP-binding protein [Candidatus Omnitrophica bacterium]|nr:ATP-binding protein [Candidatus Omnitrophota bacterium]